MRYLRERWIMGNVVHLFALLACTEVFKAEDALWLDYSVTCCIRNLPLIGKITNCRKCAGTVRIRVLFSRCNIRARASCWAAGGFFWIDWSHGDRGQITAFTCLDSGMRLFPGLFWVNAEVAVLSRVPVADLQSQNVLRTLSACCCETTFSRDVASSATFQAESLFLEPQWLRGFWSLEIPVSTNSDSIHDKTWAL